MSSNNNRQTSTGGVDRGDETPTSLKIKNMIDVLTLTSSSSAAKSANGMHFDNATVADLSVDEVAIVFGYLPPKDIFRARVCTTWREAAKKTLVPLCDFVVKDMRSYNAMRVMITALPNLQQVLIANLGHRHKYVDGEDPDEGQAARTANYTTHDINIISGFSKLRVLQIREASLLYGRYPQLFNFPLLQKLNISNCYNLKWDLGMLSGFPLLKELTCHSIISATYPTGNLNHLRVLRSTLKIVSLNYCHSIVGNFMDLADFPHLQKLYLRHTDVTGDIRGIREHDFPAMEDLRLPSTVVGGRVYKFQHVSDVPSFMQSIHPLLKRTPSIFDLTEAFHWGLSDESRDWYDIFNDEIHHLHFTLNS